MKRKNFERHFLPTHNLVCIALQTGHEERASLQSPVSSHDWLYCVRHHDEQECYAREKMRRNKIRRWFNVISKGICCHYLNKLHVTKLVSKREG